MTSIIDRDPSPEDFEAEHDAPRQGVWAGEPGADLRLLSQDETDRLIRMELVASASAAEVMDVLAATGGRVEMPPWPDDDPVRPFHSARMQRGGIDSDPLVRILARRAWGDRDWQWFALRGVRAGDAVGLADWYASGDDARVQRHWPGDSQYGVAVTDANPGQVAQVRIVQSNRHAIGSIVERRVSDRLREPPERAGTSPIDVVMREYGFETLGQSRDEMRRTVTWSATRAGSRASVVLTDQQAMSMDGDPTQAIYEVMFELDERLPPRR